MSFFLLNIPGLLQLRIIGSSKLAKHPLDIPRHGARVNKYSIRNETSVLEALRQACERGELLILVTPYMRFESVFLRLDADAVHVAASMSAEDAMFGLRSPDLRIRFPHGYSFVEGATRLLGLGSVSTRRSLRLRIPATLEEDDQRAAYRVERVGRVQVTFSTRKYALISGTLVNVSTTGARIHSLREFEDGEITVEDTIPITIPLTEELRLNTQGRIRYVQGRSVGLEFRPTLDGKLLEDVSRWVFQRQEEDRDRSVAENVAAAVAISQVSPGERGRLILVSSSQELEDQLCALLSDLPPVKRIAPTGQALKEILVGNPTLFLFQVGSTGLDAKRRLKAMVEFLGGRWPFVLLGTGEVDSASLFEIGNELKATGVYALGPKPGSFFQRLIQGILRRHYEGGEGVLAPKEP